MAIFRVWIGPLGSPYLNWITSILLGAIVFTVLILGGVAHATNLIDGLNGLAMGVCMLIAGRLAFLANAVGRGIHLGARIDLVVDPACCSEL
ncbi:MAG: hypothetical protein EBW44_05465 [Rhodobacteraceae bacterium]|nr:hypothetical protein [Paracoccaceae bacterium]